MSMIEVDPKLFITCRLCLDEMGLYQIVPQVQIHIKYCFDIEIYGRILKRHSNINWDLIIWNAINFKFSMRNFKLTASQIIKFHFTFERRFSIRPIVMSTEVTESTRSSGGVNNVPKVKKAPKTGAERAREYRARIKDIKAAGLPTTLKGALITLEKQAAYAREYRKRKKKREELQKAINKQLMTDTIHTNVDNTVVPEGISEESVNVETSTATPTALQSATIRTDLATSTKVTENALNSQEVNNVPKVKKVPKTPAERGRDFRARLKVIKAAGLPTTLKAAVQNPEKKAESARAYRERRKIRIAQFKQLMKESINEGKSTARRHCRAQRFEQVKPFDGLPQLICKKCESILRQYAEIKKKFQEKQCGLKSNIKHNATPSVPSANQQQDTVSSTQQVDSECNNQISKTKRKENKIFVSTSINSSLDREPAKDNRKLLGVSKNVAKRSNSVWKNDYAKNFVCRFCAKSLRNKKSIVHHLTQCHLLSNYSNGLRRCVITMNKIDSIPNLTLSNKNVVYSRDKIINCQLKNYYILYTKKLNEVKSISSDSSDEDFSKGLRLFSRSSNKPLVIETNNTSPSFDKSDSKDEKQNDTNSNEKESTDVIDIELINIEDSDSASTASRTTLNTAEPIQDDTPQESTIESDKVIQNIVTMCYSIYFKRLTTSARNTKDTGNDDAFLQRKILSIGRKVIHKKGLNSTGLIRYMEHKDLNVDWIPKCTANVTIKTTLKDNSNDVIDELTWRCVKDVDNTYTDKDFIDIFEAMDTVRNKEQCSQTKDVGEIENNVTLDANDDGAHLSEQSKYDDSAKLTTSSPTLVVPFDKKVYEGNVENLVLSRRTIPEIEKQSILQKLLNANPVANPKKRQKKGTPVELFTLLTNSSTFSKMDSSPNSFEFHQVSNNMSGELHVMPIITSTMSLAPVNEDETNKESNNESVNKPESETNKSHLALPRIKVKSVADLMSDNTAPKSFIDPNSWPSCFYKDDQNRLVQNKNTPMVYDVANNGASNTNINSQCPNTNSYSQYNLNKSNYKSPLVPNFKDASRNKEQYVTMHTVELPHTKTKSPFRYLQQLLQIHNIVLLCNADVVSSNMSCLIKFKLVFHQESSAAVTLCLGFYCKPNTFCIRVMDINSKHLDIDKISAYWQWEILKEFKGNVVPKLYENASKISSDILQQTYHFVRFLKSIEF